MNPLVRRASRRENISAARLTRGFRLNLLQKVDLNRLFVNLWGVLTSIPLSKLFSSIPWRKIIDFLALFFFIYLTSDGSFSGVVKSTISTFIIPRYMNKFM